MLLAHETSTRQCWWCTGRTSATSPRSQTAANLTDEGLYSGAEWAWPIPRVATPSLYPSGLAISMPGNGRGKRILTNCSARRLKGVSQKSQVVRPLASGGCPLRCCCTETNIHTMLWWPENNPSLWPEEGGAQLTTRVPYKRRFPTKWKCQQQAVCEFHTFSGSRRQQAGGLPRDEDILSPP